MRKGLAAIAVSLMCAGITAGCGSQASSDHTAAGATANSGDLVDVTINSYHVSLRESGSGSFTFPDAPEMNHSGPLGCAGHYFDIQAQTVFRYTAHNAKLLYNGNLYTFGEPP